MRISQEILQNRLGSVSEAIRTQVTSDEVAETLSQIAKDHNLHIDQASVLDEETLYVMLGLEKPDRFVGRLRERLGVSDEIATAVVKEINEKIFLSIRESLMKMQESEEAGASAEVETAPTKVEIPAESPEDIGSKEDLLAEIESHAAAMPSLAEVKSNVPAIQKQVQPQATNQPAPVQAPPAPKPPEKPKTYSTDPYREPLM